MTDKRISAIVACYREEETIPVMYERLRSALRSLTPNYEMIFIDDGSPDNSQNILTSLAQKDKQVVAIFMSRSFNNQNGISAGMEIATGDCVVVLDGDLQDPPEMIPAMVEQWLKGYEVVYGARPTRQGIGILAPLMRLYYRLFQKLAYIPIPLDAGDFSLMDRKVVDIINLMPERDRFMRGLRAWVGFRQVGIEYVRPDRLFGKSSNNLLRHFWWAKKGIFSFSYKPIELMGLLGIAVVLVSFVTLWVGLTVFLILFFAGVQILCISIIGEYLLKVVEDVKARPKYIIKSILNDPRSPQ